MSDKKIKYAEKLHDLQMLSERIYTESLDLINGVLQDTINKKISIDFHYNDIHYSALEIQDDVTFIYCADDYDEDDIEQKQLDSESLDESSEFWIELARQVLAGYIKTDGK